MIKRETYEAIKAEKISELRTTNDKSALGLEIDVVGDILGVVGNKGVFWAPNGAQLFPLVQGGIGDLTDD